MIKTITNLELDRIYLNRDDIGTWFDQMVSKWSLALLTLVYTIHSTWHQVSYQWCPNPIKVKVITKPPSLLQRTLNCESEIYIITPFAKPKFNDSMTEKSTNTTSVRYWIFFTLSYSSFMNLFSAIVSCIWNLNKFLTRGQVDRQSH